ncbi:hypothetical protein F4679DRAFT_544389 [Xylaria curta]|nr:hypothetical protein F4679DRAFT_544389 [Xylaria curta]
MRRQTRLRRSSVTAFRSQFEASRSFDLEDDMEVCPKLLTEINVSPPRAPPSRASPSRACPPQDCAPGGDDTGYASGGFHRQLPRALDSPTTRTPWVLLS